MNYFPKLSPANARLVCPTGEAGATNLPTAMNYVRGILGTAAMLVIVYVGMFAYGAVA